MASNRQTITYWSDIDGIATVSPSISSSSAADLKGCIVVFGDEDSGSGFKVRKLASASKKISELVTSSDVGTKVDEATKSIKDSIKGVYAFAAYSSGEWVGSKSYAVGSYCMHDGAGYRCVEATRRDYFDASEWECVLTATGKTSIDSLLAGCSTDGSAELADLAAGFDASSKYEVGQLVLKDDKLQICTSSGTGSGAVFSPGTVEMSVAQRLSNISTQILTSDDLRFKIVNLDTSVPPDKNIVLFKLQDRAVNVITCEVDKGKTIRLQIPDKASDGLARDFRVVFTGISAYDDVDVSFTNGRVVDNRGNSVSIKAPVSDTLSFGLTDMDTGSSLVITGYDSGLAQIEEALDEILDGYSVTTPAKNFGFYLPDSDGYYHKIRLVTTEDGEVVIGVDQEPEHESEETSEAVEEETVDADADATEGTGTETAESEPL